MSLRSRFMDLGNLEDDGLLGVAKEALLRPIRPFVSRTARRTYLTSVLLVTASFALLGLAITAYSLFYWSYIPRINFHRTIHLQFDHVFHHAVSPAPPAHPYPYGTVSLAPDMIGAQAYDITIELTLPRTRENRNAGNFMLDVSLYSLSPPSPADPNPASPLAHSRRPALLPYRSFALDTLYRFTELPLYLFNLRSETAVLRIPVFESVAFPRFGRSRASSGGSGGGSGPAVPQFLRLEIQSAGRLQIDGASAHVRARFRGLRWLMYNHRILAALLGISTFWVTEVMFAGLAWGWLSMSAAAAEAERRERGARGEEGTQDEDNLKVKSEEEAEDDKVVLSDTERTFPTLTGQPPLRYVSPEKEIKREDVESMVMVPEAVVKGTDADDEDDEEDMDFFDSGIGTSLDSAGPSRRESIRRRRGRAGRDDENGK